MGLAAPQIGILRRVCVVMDEDEQYLELVNPVIVSQEGEQEGFEGCLSLTGMYGIVKRPMKVTVKAQDRHGNPVEYEREGVTARCFCHEIEHLDGHMYYERAGRLFTEAEVDEMLQKAEAEADCRAGGAVRRGERHEDSIHGHAGFCRALAGGPGGRRT